jgi:hypothetical protein
MVRVEVGSRPTAMTLFEFRFGIVRNLEEYVPERG